MDLEQLQQQFAGAKFGKLVLHHHRKQNLKTTVAAMMATIAELPESAKPSVESWIDEIAIYGKDENFWRRDCGEVFYEICEKARCKLEKLGVTPTDEDVFSMFQVVLLNFAYGLHQHPQSKAFVQKAIGIGFLRRVLGA